MNKELEIQRATSVLNTAKNFDVIEAELPVDGETRIELAEFIISEARKAREAGENGDHVTQILYAAEVELDSSDNSDDIYYKKSIQQEIEDGLPIPPEIDESIPQLPLDLTELSDKQIIHFIGIFNACSARGNWLYAIEEAGESAAKQIADHYEQEYMVTADRKDVGGKPKTAALLKAEAQKEFPDIVKWRQREREHSKKANKYQRLRDNWDNNCDRLSRIWTIRSSERENG